MRVVLKNEVGYKYIDVSPVKRLLFIGTYFIRQINGFHFLTPLALSDYH